MALLDRNLQDPGHSHLQEIRAAAKTAAELTQGLLTFSRRVESKARLLDINHELRKISRLLERTIPKMIDIQLRLGEGLNPVKADPAQVQQILMNLALNARDSMPGGGKLVIETKEAYLGSEYCKVHPETEPGNYIMLAVSDNGTGMNRETVERIFEPFFTTKEVGKGTGLGLSIVYGIVKSHRGIITCHSELCQGTVFKVYLPSVSKGMTTDLRKEEEALPGGTETILIIDDEESVRALGEKILAKFGYEVLSASNGKEGVDVYDKNKNRISLVILDLIMPEMGGWKCLREILRIDSAAKVLIASGYAANGQIAMALEEGAKATLRKPYEARQLVETVRRVLDE